MEHIESEVTIQSSPNNQADPSVQHLNELGDGLETKLFPNLTLLVAGPARRGNSRGANLRYYPHTITN